MNVSHLLNFHAVMTSPSLSEAARKLGRTQPAVSASIKALEEHLDVRLFSREGRKLVPGPEAQYLLAEAAEVLDQITRVRQTMRALADGEEGRLVVATMPGPGAMLFPRFLAAHIGSSRGIEVSLVARSSTQIAELARAQSIDFGFVDAPPEAETSPLYEADCISGTCFVALPAAHRLAELDAVALGQLDDEPLGVLQPTHEHHRELKRRFEADGLRFRPLLESQTFLPILEFVAAGQCCAVLDPLTVAHVMQAGFAGQVVVRRLADPMRYRYAVLSTRHRPISQLARQVRHAWREEVQRLLERVEAGPRTG